MLLTRAMRPTALPASLRQLLFCHTSSAFSTSALRQSPPPNPPIPTSTVSATEMSHFSALASSWWDPHGPSRALHLMNPLRHTFIERCRNSVAPLDTAPPVPTAGITDTPSNSSSSTLSSAKQQKQEQNQGLTYLDIGCGGGIFAESAARLSTTASVTAIDPTSEVLAVAKKHARSDPLLLEPGRLNYLNTAIENLPLPATPEQGVDVLTLFEVIEHIDSPAPFLAHCLSHVKPGGWLVLSTMSRTWTAWLTTIVAAERVLGVVPPGTHDWDKYINVDEMRGWAGKQEGWGTPVVMGVVYVPGVGWREVRGSEGWGNYFFGIRREV